MTLLPVLFLALAPAQAGWTVVVHEWGTFTSITTAGGETVAWNPLVEVSDLPGFVYRGRLKIAARSTVRMETPVLYFYGDRAQRVSVEVGFPKGSITEWYPAAAGGGRSLAWRDLELLPNARAALPVEKAPSHYYPARETDAALLRVGGEAERFLFYRGVGTFALPLAARVEGASVQLRAAAGAELGTVVLFESRQGRVGHAWAELRDGEAVIDRPALDGDAGAGGLEVIARELEARGLYRREVEAMLATWREAWTEEGCRVFYVLPRAAVDAILPLKVRPEPSELVRVLVGRLEILTPEREAAVRARARAGRPGRAHHDPDRFAGLMLERGR